MDTEPFTLKYEPAFIPRTIPQKREKLEPKPTRRQMEMIHDAEVMQGCGVPGRGCFSQPINEDEAWFRHHNWREKRSRILSMLGKSGFGIRQIDAFANCGAE